MELKNNNLKTFIIAILLLATSCVPIPTKKDSSDLEYDDTPEEKRSGPLVKSGSLDGLSGAELYEESCMKCHGTLVNSTKRRSDIDANARAIKNAIDDPNVISMNHLTNLSIKQIQLIAEALAFKEVDRTPPKVVLPAAPAKVFNGDFSTQLTFNEDIKTFDSKRVSIEGGFLSRYEQRTQRQFEIFITPLRDGIISVKALSGTGLDSSGNPSEPSNQSDFFTDLTAPLITLSSSAPVTVKGTLDILITLSEEVTGLTKEDFLVQNGTVSSLLPDPNGSKLIYLASITPGAAGGISVSIPANSVNDLAGNSNKLASNGISRIYDNTTPTLSLSLEADIDLLKPTNKAFKVTARFGSPVKSLNLSQFTITGGTASNLRTSTNQVFVFTVTPKTSGLLTIYLPANSVENSMGAKNNPSSLAVNVDLIAPKLSFDTMPLAGTESEAGLKISGQCETGLSTGLAGDIKTPRNIACSNGRFSADILFSGSDGTKLVKVSQTDLATNHSEISRSFKKVSLSLADQRFNAAKDVIARYCLNCHGSSSAFGKFGEYTKDTRAVAEDKFINGYNGEKSFVTPGDLANSLLIKRMKGFGAGNSNMPLTNPPSGEAYAGKHYDLVKGWIMGLEKAADTKAPTATLSPNIAATSVTGPFIVAANFSEDLKSFDQSKIEVINGTISDYSMMNPKQYKFTVNPSKAGGVSVRLLAGAGLDLAGNMSLQTTRISKDYVVDDIPPAPPKVTPASQSFTTAFNASLSAETGATIRYRLGTGTLNCTQGTLYSGPITIPIGADVQLRSVACDKFQNLSGTAVASYMYIKPAPGQVGDPTITPLSGTFDKLIDVSITGEAGTSIRYTLDGSNPTCNSGNIYSQSFNLASGQQAPQNSVPAANIVHYDSFDIAPSSTSATTPKFVSGKVKGAYDFDGVDDYIILPLDNSQQIDHVSISAWVNRRDSGDDRIACKSKGIQNADMIYCLALYNGKLRGRITTSSGALTIVSTQDVPLNKWSHVAMTYDGAALSLYIDGVNVLKRNHTGKLVKTNNPILIGNNSIGVNRFFNGLIDEVKILNTGSISINDLMGGVAPPASIAIKDYFVKAISCKDNNSSNVITVKYTVDKDPIGITSPEENAEFPSDFVINGKCEAGLNVTLSGDIMGGQKIVSCGGSFTTSLILSTGEGFKTIVASQTDSFGNKRSVTRKVVRVLPPPPPLDGVALYGNEGYHCAKCHNALSNTNLSPEIRGRTIGVQDIKDAIFGSASKKAVGAMATDKLKQATDEELQRIVAAIKNATKPDPLPGGENSLSGVLNPLGDRTYLSSKMKSLFSNSAGTADDKKIDEIIDDYIFRKPAVFGGPCSLVTDSCPGYHKLYDEQELISNRALGNPTPNALRSGYRIKACQETLQYDRAISNALTQVGLNTSSERSLGNVSKVFHLMTSRTFPSVMYPSFQLIDSEMATSADSWKNFMLIVCKSTTFEEK